jgi:hypothetical protein
MQGSADVCDSLRESAQKSAEVCTKVCKSLREFTGAVKNVTLIKKPKFMLFSFTFTGNDCSCVVCEEHELELLF